MWALSRGMYVPTRQDPLLQTLTARRDIHMPSRRKPTTPACLQLRNSSETEHDTIDNLVHSLILD